MMTLKISILITSTNNTQFTLKVEMFAILMLVAVKFK
jgi:hypothetical protein